jgi:tetratricopeptide (TPR) repeat protein
MENIDFGRSLINIAKMQVHLSDFNAAISSYQRAIFTLSNSNQRDEEEFIDTYRRLGRIYEEKRKFEKALDHYRIALALPARSTISVYMDIAHQRYTRLFVSETKEISSSSGAFL